MFSLLQQAAGTAVDTGTPADDATGEAAAGHGADAAGHAADAAQHAVGMPQLDTQYFGNLIFWLLVTLGLLYWVLSRVALPRIGGVISDRQGVITGDLMQAEEYKKKARDAEVAYDKALADARSEAGKIVAAQKAEIQKDLDAAILHADAEIAARAAESENVSVRSAKARAPTCAAWPARSPPNWCAVSGAGPRMRPSTPPSMRG